MAKKRAKSGAKTKTTKATTKPAAKPAPRPAAASRPAKPAAKAATRTASPRPAAAREPSALERAEGLRDAIQRSKLTAQDPWAYTAKARGWAQKAQELVDRIARDGETAGTRHALDTLSATVEGDRDFQEARRLF